MFGELGFNENPGVSSMMGEEGVGEGVGGVCLDVVPTLGGSG